MEIISHRGFWQNKSEKNTEEAFIRSFEYGYGTETDFRDFNGQLVISHDIPSEESFITAERFFELYIKSGTTNTLAINIKSDGLQSLIKAALKKHNISNYFLFDASIPDSLVSIQHNLRVLARHSEFEPSVDFWDIASGVWFDRFSSKYSLNLTIVQDVLFGNKIAAIVSDELHDRNHIPIWSTLLLLPNELLCSKKLILCTDIPDEASIFFKDYIE